MPDGLRLGIYGCLAALGALLVVYGVIEQDHVPLWLNLADQLLTTLALLLAAKYVPAVRTRVTRSDE